jgi:hypothetical protein
VPKKNSENVRILQSHNQLSTGCLQKNAETSIYKNAEIGKAEMSLKNLIADGTDFTDARKDYGKPGKPRTTERREESRWQRNTERHSPGLTDSQLN